MSRDRTVTDVARQNSAVCGATSSRDRRMTISIVAVAIAIVTAVWSERRRRS
jgi:hypothetical protein